MANLSSVQDRSCVDVANGLIKLSREYRQTLFALEELKLRIPLYKSAPYCYAQIFPAPWIFRENEFKSRYNEVVKGNKFGQTNFEEARHLLYSNKPFNLAGIPSDLYTRFPSRWGIKGSFNKVISSDRYFDPQSLTWKGRTYSESEIKNLNQQLKNDS